MGTVGAEIRSRGTGSSEPESTDMSCFTWLKFWKRRSSDSPVITSIPDRGYDCAHCNLLSQMRYELSQRAVMLELPPLKNKKTSKITLEERAAEAWKREQMRIEAMTKQRKIIEKEANKVIKKYLKEAKKQNKADQKKRNAIEKKRKTIGIFTKEEH